TIASAVATTSLLLQTNEQASPLESAVDLLPEHDFAGAGPARNSRRGNVRITDSVLLDGVQKNVRLEFILRLRPARERLPALVFRLSPAEQAELDSPALGRLDLLRVADPKDGARKFDGRMLRFLRYAYS